jgi:type II secretory pathway component GspD/PulD (secretin)
VKKLGMLLLLLLLAKSSGAENIPRLDFENAPVLEVVQALARSRGFDLVMAGDPAALQGKRVTVHLKNISLEEAIETILRTNGLCFEQKGRTYLISSLPQDLNASGYRATVDQLLLKYLPASRTAELLGKLFPGAIFQAGERGTSVLFRGKESELNEAKELLAKIDRPIPQILIESKVVELSRNDSTRLGIAYGNGGVKFATIAETKKTDLGENITSTLNALIAGGKANVLATPRIATLDNREAVINIGNRVPYAVPVGGNSTTAQWTVEYLDAGVRLKVLPQLGQDGALTIQLQPEVSSIAEWRTTTAGDFPVIATRNAATTVRVKDGETIVIGGLLSEVERENVARLPLLGYLPLIGLLFQNKTVEKEKTEIVFMVTPRVI